MNIHTNSVSLIRDRISQYLGMSHAGERNLYTAFGYPAQIDAEVLVGFYRRNDIANRIIKAPPQATWREMPDISDEKGDSPEKDTDSFSEFSKSANDLFKRHRVIRVMERADRLASLARFGLLFMGFADGKKSEEPLLPGEHKLLFITPYSELGVQVSEWETNVQSARFGLPVRYNITRSSLSMDDGSSPSRSLRVHHSRVLHLSEFLDQDEVYGVPRLLPIANRLYDLEKVVGGAAETFWLTANRGIAYWADKEASLEADEIEKIKTQADEMAHDLRRSIVGTGMTAQVLGSESPDPEPNVTVLLDLIAGAVAIPKRILIGSERGELSSEQDENNWAERIVERRNNFASPMMLEPFIQKMIDTGNVIEPDGEWAANWPEESSLSPASEAAIGVQRSTALATYANSPDSQLIVPPQEFRRDVLGLPSESEFDVDVIEDIPEDDDEGEGFSTNVDEDISQKKTLFAFRRVRNHAAIRRWAKSQGLKDINTFLHVTIAYSLKRLDWVKVWQPFDDEESDGSMIISKSDQRSVEMFGGTSADKERCIVLRFGSSELEWRHQEIGFAGASYDFGEFKPHITITATIPDDLDIKSIKPFKSAIVLEAEEFAEIETEVE